MKRNESVLFFSESWERNHKVHQKTGQNVAEEKAEIRVKCHVKEVTSYSEWEFFPLIQCWFNTEESINRICIY